MQTKNNQDKFIFKASKFGHHNKNCIVFYIIPFISFVECKYESIILSICDWLSVCLIREINVPFGGYSCERCCGFLCKIFGWILFILFEYVYVLVYLSCVCVYYMCYNLTHVCTMKYRYKTIYTHKPYKITSNSKQCLYICI